jgi:hypothetical protein
VNLNRRSGASRVSTPTTNDHAERISIAGAGFAAGQNNGAAGVPLGLDFTRNQLLVGLTRQFSQRLTGALHYEFSQYAEPGSGQANIFSAHGIFATLACQWP